MIRYDCMGKRLTNEDVDKRLASTNVRRIEDYTDAKIAIQFKCILCNCSFYRTIRQIMSKTVGCPGCGKTRKLTNNIIDTNLTNRNIKRLDDCINASTHIRFQCLDKDCNFIWFAAPTKIMSLAATDAADLQNIPMKR
jgi:hypothetical protein